MKLKDLCKESPKFKAKIVSLVLAGPIGAHDKNTGKPTFQGQQCVHEYCSRRHLTVREICHELNGNVFEQTLFDCIHTLTQREFCKGRMKRKKVLCSVTNMKRWGYKSTI